ncbi:MAG: protein kinase family protein [Myxococcota bacterium]
MPLSPLIPFPQQSGNFSSSTFADPLGNRIDTPADLSASFEIDAVELIGDGGSARVYKVQTVSSGSYAVKEMSASRDPRTEIKALQKLSIHPHVVHFVGSKKNDETIRITTDLINAESLQRQTPSAADFKIIFKQLLQTLDFCHGEGIAHLDIKPANLLWNADSRELKVIDFGEARFFDPICPFIEEAHLPIGTPQYRDDYLDASLNPVRIDLYSAGVTLKELFVQRATPDQATTRLINRCLSGHESIVSILMDPWFDDA